MKSSYEIIKKPILTEDEKQAYEETEFDGPVPSKTKAEIKSESEKD